MQPIVEVKNLKKSYKKRKTKEYITAVDDISFTVNKGEILGLLGPNGAGKTTTIKMICGLVKPDGGSISINGIDNQKKRLQAQEHISAVLEGNRNLYWRLTVRENLEYFAGNRGKSRKEVAAQIDELLEQFNLKDKEKEMVNRLSRGMQQKLAIAVAMLAGSEVILLDEPTLGLDIETGYEVRELLREVVRTQNKTIIITSHDMDVIQDLCERTVIINSGKVVINDYVENLMRLFEVRAYSIKLDGHLSEEQHHLLLEKFPQLVYTPDTYQSVLEVDLTQSQEMYDLFDILKLEQIPVDTIDRKTINFEQVFMKIVKGRENMRFLNVLNANIRREYILLKRYLPNTIAMLFTFYVLFLGMFFGITLIGDPSTQDANIQYVIVNYIFWFLAMVVVNDIGWQITNEATQGTLEQLGMSPMGIWKVMFSRLLSTTLVDFVIIIGLLYLSMFTAGQWLNVDVLSILPVLILTLISMFGLGLIIAGFTMILKQIQAFLQILQFLLAGLTFVPLSVAPFLAFFPFVKGIDMVREIMINGVAIHEFAMADIAILVFNAVFYFGIGLFIFLRCERFAMQKGLLAHY